MHQPVRLELLALLHHLPKGRAAPFRDLRGHLGLTAPNLSYHLERLEDIEYVDRQVLVVGSIRTTLVGITDRGRAALTGHVRALGWLLEPHGLDVGPPWLP